MAYEDHRNKGFMLPFELLKFVFGEKERKIGLKECEGLEKEKEGGGKKMYDKIRQNVIEETDKIRRQEHNEQIGDIIRKNKKFILREINKIKRKNDKKTTYNNFIKKNYLKQINNNDETNQNEKNKENQLKSNTGSKTQRLTTSEKHEKIKENMSQEKKKNNSEINVNVFMKIIENINGSVGRKPQLKKFSQKFVDLVDPSKINLPELMLFLNTDRHNKSLKKRSRSFAHKINEIGNSFN
jgi:hypothetical protein